MPLRAWLGWRELAAAALAGAVTGAWWFSLDRALERESEKAAFLRLEVAKLDREIADIASLREMIGALLARKQVVEMLQTDRSTSVALLEQLARQRPRGVYYSALREEGARVFIAGFAASEREVSELLRNLEGSPLFSHAQLLELRREGSPRLAGYPARFSASASLRGKRALPRAGPLRMPSDVHPGDPK